jgi:hypothetical protein
LRLRLSFRLRGLDERLGLGLLGSRWLSSLSSGGRVLVEDTVVVIVTLSVLRGSSSLLLGLLGRRLRLSDRLRSSAGGGLRGLGLLARKVESGVSLDALGDGLDLSHPLDLGDDLWAALVNVMTRFVALVHLEMRVVRVVNVRLSSDSGHKKCRSGEGSSSLHAEVCWLLSQRVYMRLFPYGVFSFHLFNSGLEQLKVVSKREGDLLKRLLLFVDKTLYCTEKKVVKKGCTDLFLKSLKLKRMKGGCIGASVPRGKSENRDGGGNAWFSGAKAKAGWTWHRSVRWQSLSAGAEEWVHGSTRLTAKAEERRHLTIERELETGPPGEP